MRVQKLLVVAGEVFPFLWALKKVHRKDEKIIPFVGDDLMNTLDMESAGRDGDEKGGRLAGAPPWKAALSREGGRR